MTDFEEQFANDIATLNEPELMSKYRGRIQPTTTIRGVVDALSRQGQLEKLIRTDWQNNGRDRDGLYLIVEGQRFQVFMGERGIKNWLEEYDDIKSACWSWVELTLNELSHTASDSRIK